jgi:hypothetical protein
LGYCSLVSRRDLIERVLAGLPASSDSVALPDHPLLLQGPDVLASVRNVLTAYFILDRPTRRLPIKILSNVVLSRLALPRETNFVLMLGEGADIRDNDTEAFEEVVEMSGNRSSRTPAGRMNESRGAELMELLRRPHDERFARAWASTARRRESHHEIAGDPTSLRTPEIRPTRTRYMDFENGSFILPSPGPESSIRPRELLNRATHVAVRTDYWLDLGVSGIGEVAQLVRSDRAHLALHENLIPLPTGRRQFDILKPFRAAAFAGFATKVGYLNAL